MSFLSKVYAKHQAVSKKLLTEKDAVLSHSSLAKSDLEDAFNVVLFAVGLDENGDPNPEFLDEVIRTWNAAVKKGKVATVPMSETKKYSYYDHGRRVKKNQIDNPIIVAKVGASMVVLDGNHRLLTRKDQNKKDIQVFVISLPYDAITNMEGSVGE